MPVFDFSNAPGEKKTESVCTYTTFQSNEKEKTADEPILVLDNKSRQWKHHSGGVFANQSQQTAFEFKEESETYSADILKVDARFVSLIKWVKTEKKGMLYTRFVRQPLEQEPNCPQRTVFYSL